MTGVLTYLEVGSYGGGTGEEARKQHVDRDRNSTANIPFPNLNVLDL